jgi:hypothetical protein
MIEVESIQICCGPDVVAEYRAIGVDEWGEQKDTWAREIKHDGYSSWQEFTDPEDRQKLWAMATGDSALLAFCTIDGVEYTNLAVCVEF